MKALLAAISLAILAAAPLRADPLALYRAGDYEKAAAEGARSSTAPDLVVATRAMLAQSMVRSPCLDCLKRAAELARRAIATAPGLAEGHVFLAVALGYEARIVGVMQARRNGFPEEAKRELDIALKDDPSNPWGLAALGGWNIEVVRGGGSVLAQWLYGANVEAGRKEFAAAFKVAPDNLVLRYQYALSLGGLDSQTYREDVKDALASAISGKPQTAYEIFAQGRARELLAALDDRAKFEQLVRRDQGYP
ncbi:MAG: hypothetical protein JO261_01525 [Alphaproteobacteria bacterium]|nr:hypothetical protein [Alphaproteobacteria bacterium]MBV9692357.1 hypothetical protein [Alphaproteobacteria bacterium]